MGRWYNLTRMGTGQLMGPSVSVGPWTTPLDKIPTVAPRLADFRRKICRVGCASRVRGWR